MNTKKRLNCYLFSNLILCFLSLNMMINPKVTVLKRISQDRGNLDNIYETEEVLAYDDVEEENQEETPKTTTVSVTNRVVTSKNVISYVKPSYNSVTGNNLVSYAKHYLGLRYVSAGRSLSTGTDCSGFTMLIYREFGINLGTTVSSQLYSGKYVSKADLQPGDLVFYGYSSGHASHVAIYMGNGLIIHQSNPRDGVKISSLNIMVYITARRVIFASTKPKEEIKEEVTKPDISETKPSNEAAPNTPSQEEDIKDFPQTDVEEIPKEEVPVEEETPKEENPPVLDEQVENKEPSLENSTNQNTEHNINKEETSSTTSNEEITENNN